MEWQTRRRILYILALLVTVGSISVFLLRDVISPSPTCGDKKQNGYEIGIDCGGVCALRCSSEVIPLTALWSKAIPAGEKTYDFVAMISNKNINHSAHVLFYIFTAYDKDGRVIAEIEGKTDTPIDGDFPIIKQAIVLDKKPYNVTVKLNEGYHYKVHEKPTSPTLRIVYEHYEAGTVPRVYATIQNTKRRTLLKIPVIVVLYDQYGNVYAAGETVIPKLEKEEEKEIVFTWKNQLPYAPVRIRVYPIFNPFLVIE